MREIENFKNLIQISFNPIGQGQKRYVFIVNFH